MKIKFDDHKVEPISEEYSNLKLFLNGKQVYKATMPNDEVEKFKNRKK